MGSNTITKKHIHSLTIEMEVNCVLSAKELNGITKNLDSLRTIYHHTLPDVDEKCQGEIRNKRKIIVGIIALVSIVSLFQLRNLYQWWVAVTMISS